APAALRGEFGESTREVLRLDRGQIARAPGGCVAGASGVLAALAEIDDRAAADDLAPDRQHATTLARHLPVLARHMLRRQAPRPALAIGNRHARCARRTARDGLQHEPAREGAYEGLRTPHHDGVVAL